MNAHSFMQLLRETRLDALNARDRFYREGAAGQLPRDLHLEIVISVMKLESVVREFQPLNQRDELPDISNIEEVVFDEDLDATAVDAAEAVELIDELDALARKHGMKGEKA